MARYGIRHTDRTMRDGNILPFVLAECNTETGIHSLCLNVSPADHRTDIRIDFHVSILPSHRLLLNK